MLWENCGRQTLAPEEYEAALLRATFTHSIVVYAKLGAPWYSVVLSVLPYSNVLQPSARLVTDPAVCWRARGPRQENRKSRVHRAKTAPFDYAQDSRREQDGEEFIERNVGDGAGEKAKRGPSLRSG